MIEINLRPGGKKRAARRPSLKLPFPIPKLGALPKDRWVLGVSAYGILAVVAAAYLWFGVSGRHEELTVQVEEAARDSVRYADLISKAQALNARRDSIAQRVALIQEIDAHRYTWPHLMDEVGAALPDYTWLTEFIQVEVTEQLTFRVRGRTGNNFALTRFMRNLEASPFVRNVTLISTEQVLEGDRTVSEFNLEATYETPPPEMIETVPLLMSSEPPQ